MSESMERHSHISITRTSAHGVTHTEVQISEVGIDADHAASCFNPDAVCDPQERALIEELRAYLRPQQAPERLISRLEAVLDRCCGAEQGEQDDAAAGQRGDRRLGDQAQSER